MVSFWGLHYAPRNDHKGARAPPFLQEETDVTEPGSHHRSHTARTPRTEAVEEIPSRPGSRAECLHMLSNVHLKADERAVSSKHLAVPRCVTAGQKGSTEASPGESRWHTIKIFKHNVFYWNRKRCEEQIGVSRVMWGREC